MELPGNLVDDLMTEYGLRDALARYSGRSKASTKGNFSEKGTYIDPLVILTDGVDEWRVDDGVRSLYDPKTVAVTFRDVLARLKISHLELGENIKDIEERVAWVMTASGLKDCQLTADMWLTRSSSKRFEFAHHIDRMRTEEMHRPTEYTHMRNNLESETFCSLHRLSLIQIFLDIRLCTFIRRRGRRGRPEIGL